jgi:hypothetical protein
MIGQGANVQRRLALDIPTGGIQGVRIVGNALVSEECVENGSAREGVLKVMGCLRAHQGEGCFIWAAPSINHEDNI